MERLETLVKPLLRGVLLKVHPDFFASEPVAKRINQEAVQRLQSVMAPITKQPADKPTAGPIEFMHRTDDSLQKLSFSFADYNPRSGRSYLGAQRARELLDLCTRLRVPVSEDTAMEVDRIAKEIEAKGSSRRQSKMPMSDAAVAALRAARAREARQNYARAQARDPNDEFREKLRQSAWFPSSTSMGAKKAVLRLDRSRVFFAQDVDPRSYDRVVQAIERKLPELRYALWSSLPLMIVSSWKASFRGDGSKYPGFVVIPADFSTSEFTRYLQENLADIRHARQQRMSQACR